MVSFSDQGKKKKEEAAVFLCIDHAATFLSSFYFIALRSPCFSKKTNYEHLLCFAINYLSTFLVCEQFSLDKKNYSLVLQNSF